jgi:hypothetical protein
MLHFQQHRIGVLLLLIFVFFLGACAQTKKKLIGSWQYDAGAYQSQVIYRDDGTFVQTLVGDSEFDKGKQLGSVTGKWEVKKKTIQGQVSSSTFSTVKPGDKWVDQIITLEEGKLVTKTQDGDTETWIRPAPKRNENKK